MLKPKPERLAKGQWWDRSWNLVAGCTPVDESCQNCWGAREAARFAHNPNPKVRAAYEGLTDAGGRWTGQVRFRRELLDLPLRTRTPAVWALWMDLFHHEVRFRERCQTFQMMANASQHLFLVLTKRPTEALRWYQMAAERGLCQNTCDPLPNVWLGTSASNQDTADQRIPELLRCPAALHFVSCEPLLGPVDLRGNDWAREALDSGVPKSEFKSGGNRIGLVIAGGESGPGARPTHPDWVRSLRDECQAAGIPFFFKQWGEWLQADGAGERVTNRGAGHRYDTRRLRVAGCECQPYEAALAWNGKTIGDPPMVRVGKKRAGRLLDGREWLQWPGDAADEPTSLGVRATKAKESDHV